MDNIICIAMRSIFSTFSKRKGCISTSLVSKLSTSVDSISQQSPRIRMKFKVPQKRASKLIGILRNEEFEKLKAGRERPNFLPGDSIAIEKVPFVTAKESQTIKGVVIGRTNRGSDTSFMVLSVENGTPVFRRLPLYSPLIKDIKVLQTAFIHGGKKRVKRKKLYYLLDRDPEEYTVI